MTFYPSPYRRNLFQMPRQSHGLSRQTRLRGPNDYAASPNQFRGVNNYIAPQNQFESRPYFNPYEQPPYGRPRTDFNTMMGHVGTITNSINMMRQIGGLMSLFR